MRIFAVFLLLLFLNSASPALATEPLFVGDARVDVMGESAEDAKELGTREARRKALNDLFTKFVPSQRSILMDGLQDETIEAMSRGIKFDNEQIDGNRFRADAKVSFSATAFNKIIKDKIADVESDKQLVTTASLILPVYETPERIYLFETVNAWGTAWQEIARNIGRGTLITPYGDSVDYSMIRPKDALTESFQAFTPLVRRYGVRDVVIVNARLITPDDESTSANTASAREKRETVIMPKTLRITERRVQAFQEEVQVLDYVADSDETDEQLMTRAARDIGLNIMRIQHETIDIAAEKQKVLHDVIALVQITTMQRYHELRAKLEKVAAIQSVEVLAVQPRQVDLRIIYTGEAKILRDAMNTAGIHVDDHQTHLEISL